mmetsp:Transcript_447/g.586  ORF Transcript_447/g.586 Transcript_447/m.586 type:complete len:181 (-) Transcript_447:131-673(-)|eukprot:CAMPEP_0117754664 /NCGR_PEP_ID=MMETSP0947-20121206/12956_1 /TAXON_ID=44440 /ORGANISM="Chattonella subsalsa, Strain CCMP2191" /LENGTH=180 /DNA_ID=CAMNT_0005573781 /DNA_START=114 /DNA_END=656 /DNA_ORIENTATION=-
MAEFDITFDELSVALSYGLLMGKSEDPAPTKGKGKEKKKEQKKPKKDEEDDLFGDDDDLFGDDDAPAVDAKEARKARAEAAKKKKEKAKPVERTQVVFEVKPWEADTDLNELASKIREIKKEGLVWGEGIKLVPVAFGIKKLVMSCVIVDDLVCADDITDPVEAMEDYVQSVDICTMSKI